MEHFFNQGYIFKDIFAHLFVGTYRFNDWDSVEITSRIILVFT